MNPIYKNSSVVISCPGCEGATSTYENSTKGIEFGTVVNEVNHIFNNQKYTRIIYILMKCANCNSGGLAKVHCINSPSTGKLESFYPSSFQPAKLPLNTPAEIKEEFKEAEACMSHQLWRAASALFRSVIEKIFCLNGYNEKKLFQKIDAAAADLIITASRQQKAHDEVRSLGNDVLHDDWRVVTREEAELAHHYVQRITEDFYDDRLSVESILKKKNRI